MEKIDFNELATYCVNQFKEEHNSSRDHYVRTLYVSISEDKQVKCSTTPHVLKETSKCLLIHEHSELAISNYYSWYKVQFIDENGCVHDGNLGDGYTLEMFVCGSYSNIRLALCYNKAELYACKAPFEDKIIKVLELYYKVKDLSSEKEVRLVAELFRKDESIIELGKQVENFKFENHLLEMERNQYKDMLNEIKEMVSNNLSK